MGNVITRSDALPGVKVMLLCEADKSDPLNQLTVAGAKFGDNFAVRGVVSNEDHEAPISAAIAALVSAVIENHAEIRDALAEKS